VSNYFFYKIVHQILHREFSLLTRFNGLGNTKYLRIVYAIEVLGNTIVVITTPLRSFKQHFRSIFGLILGNT
jgi:hypothetical protein